MSAPQDEMAFARLAHKVAPGSALLRVRTLHGGISARVTGLDIKHGDGQTQTLIVRQHGAVDLARNPNIAADEFALLRVLYDAGLPTPMPYFVDQSAELFATPVVVVEYIEGESVFTLADTPDFLPQFATRLVQIHQVDCTKDTFSFLPSQDELVAAKISNPPATLDDSLAEGRIRAALEAAWPWPQQNISGLLHGDYWPGNILWRDGRLVGVIDWEDAARGDPLADLANSRLEILWAFGDDVMHDFTRRYTALNPIDVSNLPYWDLYVALRHIPHIRAIGGDDADAEAQLRKRHRLFVAQAFERLPAR
jgi:aminoglycoside phosphotransferase (APT) family kinase protein